ncbi:hypothetical protein [Streptomyces synnematoformans]|uniref:Uncharacterized protein n=1 Tax=Streptomyces synnematoformans TaxID=415721 RepID=A0ABP5JS59_9ACTN
MTRVVFQFHADRDELVALAGEWAARLGLYMAWERFFPDYRVQAVTPDELVGVREHQLSEISRISLSLCQLELDADSSLGHVKCNPGILTILLGEQSDSFIGESFLAAVAESEEQLKVWRKVRGFALKSTCKGAWIVNGMTGVRQRSDSHRYTPKVREMAGSGVRVVGPSEWIEYFLD